MINCKFVYCFANGAASDSVRTQYDVQYVPSIGDSLFLDEQESKFVVTEVAHRINRSTGDHEVFVYYTDAE